MKHGFVTFDNIAVRLTSDQYAALNKEVLHGDGDWLNVAGSRYHIKSIKFMGDLDKYHGTIKSHSVNDLPLIQAPKEKEPTPLADLFLHGITPPGWSKPLREVAAKTLAAHIARHPALDAKVKELSLKAWQETDTRLPADHPRKGIKPTQLQGSVYMSSLS